MSTVGAMRGSNGSGADPVRIAEQDTRLFERNARHRAARERVERGDVIPLDLMADLAATRAAIAAHWPQLAR